MPFTFSHPAVVLPLNYVSKKWISLTGLIVGSVTPDFEYFITMGSKRVYGHTWTGLFWFDLPLSILLAFLFHNLVRNPLVSSLPVPLQRRLLRYTWFNWNAWFKKKWSVIAVSILIGGCSHLLLDRFTEESMEAFSLLPALNNKVSLFGWPTAIYSLLYYLYSVLGIIVIVYAIWQLPVDKKTRTIKSVLPYWLILFVLTIAIFIFRISFTPELMMLNMVSFLYFGQYIIIATSAFLIALILTSLFFRRRTYQTI